MGKIEEEQMLENAARRFPPCRSFGRILSLRCVAVLLFGIAVLLSGVLCLPPFFKNRAINHDPRYRADVVASFILQKPISLLNANVAKLQNNIFNEIGVPNTTVAVIYLDPSGINTTTVVFGVWPYPKNSNISTGLSILKSYFVSLVLQQSTLHLTTALFGSSYFFQILEFPGGITLIPPQIAFLLQKEHMLFNFTLNFPIYQVQDKIDELKDQMKFGLHLKSYEILFVKLTNTKGSTVASPTIVETSIVLAVGNNQPSVPRLKQLAQTIRNYSTGNLGLNHTIFGRVKQIRLSSFLQHSLNAPAATHHQTTSPNEVAPTPSTDLHPKSHLPHAIFSRAKPPSESVNHIKARDGAPSILPSQSSSFVAGLTKNCWVFAPLLHLLVLL